MRTTFENAIRIILEQEGIPENSISVSLSSDPVKARRGMYLVLVDNSRNREVGIMLHQSEVWVVQSGPDSDVYALDFKHEPESIIQNISNTQNTPIATFQTKNLSVSGSEEFVSQTVHAWMPVVMSVGKEEHTDKTRELREALFTLRGATADLMGDSDLPYDDSPEFLAMQKAAKVLEKYPAEEGA